MKIKLRHSVAAAAVVGLLGFGGVSLAAAQENGSTTTTPSTQSEGSTTAPGPGEAHEAPDGSRQGNCPNRGGSSGGESGTSSSGSSSSSTGSTEAEL